MPIGWSKEELITLAEVTDILPKPRGRKIAISTVWLWCMKGLSGVRLEHARVGRRIFTSRDAVNRFLNDLAAADIARVAQPEASMDRPVRYLPKQKRRRATPLQRQKEIEAARRRVEELGL